MGAEWRLFYNEKLSRFRLRLVIRRVREPDYVASSGARLLRLVFPDCPRVLLDGEWVIFNPVSWEVHILNAAASVVFEYLAECPRTLVEIQALLRELLVEDEVGNADQHARRVISELSALGLVDDRGIACGAGR